MTQRGMFRGRGRGWLTVSIAGGLSVALAAMAVDGTASAAQAAERVEAPAVQEARFVTGSSVPVRPRPANPVDTALRDRAPAVSWPQAGGAAVTVGRAQGGERLRGPAPAAAPSQVGGLPVRLQRTSPEPAATKAGTAPAATVEVLGRDETRRAGVSGVLLRVTPPAGSKEEGLRLDVDYSSFADAFGGDWSTRLRMYSLPACALTTPSRDTCQQLSPVPSSTNDVEDRTVSGVVTVPGTATRSTAAGSATSGTAAAAVLVAVEAASAGGAGDYTATPLSPSASWQAGSQTGSFSWSYPLRVPPGVNGPTPQLSIAYDSGAVDGRTSSTNNQPSWIGDGFSLESGYVERQYVPCAEDMSGGNNTTRTGDLCWRTDNASLVLTGHSGELVKDTGNTWRLKNDDGSRIERLTGATNADNDKEYWRLTTLDGTQYYFGLGKRYSSDTVDTRSTLTVPVAGNQSGEPCFTSGNFAGSFCTQAWRWNLDYVVDVHGNTMTYSYTKETNRYRRGPAAKSIPYDRAATLASIEYGERKGSEGTTVAPARVLFGAAERCVVTATFDCAPAKLIPANASKWPDVPVEQVCTNTTECTLSQTSPTFFTSKRLNAVTTQVRTSATAYDDVDQWNLRQAYPATGDGTSPGLWLQSISHIGKVGTDTEPLTVSFNGIQLRNRVEDLDGAAPLIKWRVNAVDSETGGRLSVTYAGVDCTPSSLPSPSTNTRRCFPGYWSPEGATNPTLTWFHKYPVTRVVESDLVAGSPDKVTSYEYVGGAAWHYDDNELTRPRYRTWSGWRGYQTVRVRTGDSGTPNTLRQITYLRGMHDDYLGPNSRRSVTVTDSQGGTVTDVDRLNGFVLEDVTYNGVGGLEVTGTVNRPWVSAPTAGSGIGAATLMATASTTLRTRLTKGTSSPSDDTYRTTRTSTTHDADTGLAVQVHEAGDIAVATDDVCRRTTYVKNPTLHILDAVARVEAVSKACSVDPSRPADVVSDVRTYFDGATSLTTAPTRGLVTRTERLKAWTTAGVYEIASRATYDAHGRVLDYHDGLDRLTRTAYTPATGGPVTQVRVTNPLNHVNVTTVEPAWGVPVTELDANARRTDLAYDGLGRLTRVWLPGRSKVEGAASNLKFVYTVRTNGPSVVKSSELNASGNYTDSYALFDGLLRARQSQVPASGSTGGRLVTETRYDSRGLVIDERGPYAATGSPGPALLESPNPVPVQTEKAYDGAGRMTAAIYKVQNAEKWRTTVSHEGDRVSTTPPQGDTPTTVINDALGRMVEKRQYKGAAASGDFVRTTYTYRAGGKEMTSMTGPPSAAAPSGSTWSYGYDLAGRQVTTVDPTKGTTTSTYDAANQVTSVLDGRGTRLFHEYDALGRKTRTRSGSATGPVQAEWTYDTVANGKGKAASSTRYAGGRAYVSRVTGYDELYRPTGGSVTIPAAEGALAGTYTTSMEYARDGNLASIALPAAGDLPAERLNYAFNDLGEATSMTSPTGGAYVSQVLRTPFGEQARLDLTRTDAVGWQTFEYEEGTRRLLGMRVQRANQSTAQANLTYGYDPAGNVTQIADRPSGGAADVQCFEYDRLRRLTHAWTPQGACADTRATSSLGGPAPYWHSFTYDAAGNRLTEVSHAAAGDVTRSYAYGKAGGAQPDTMTAVTQTGPSGSRAESYTYDAAGNQTGRTIAGVSQTLDWDAEGRVTSITQGTGTTAFVYDADGSRLMRRDPSGTTLYLPGGQELRVTIGSNAVKGTRYYAFDGDVVAVRTTTGVSFTFSDHQGTGQWAVQEGTLAFSQRRFTPFGAPRGPAVGTWVGEKGFVGGTNDSSTGLTHLGARLYDPAVGRFVSVDPLFDATDPQTWNGYAYANNSPITFSDATGLSFWSSIVDAVKKVFEGVKKIVSGDGGRRTVAAEEVSNTRKKHEEQKERIKKVATEIIKIAADELGITAGIDCFSNGDMGACAETAVTVLSSFVGGLAGKLIGKYGAPWNWRKGYELAQRLYRLGSEAVDSIGGWFNTRRDLEKAEKAYEAVQSSCSGNKAGNSFFPGTPVVLSDGSVRPIEELLPGDTVLATDPVTGESVGPPVVATIIGQGVKSLVTITVAGASTDSTDGQDAASSLVATDKHPFWVSDRKAWVDAAHLVVGDVLRTPNGRTVRVASVRAWTASTRVHNLSVQTIHTYYVLAGRTPVLVHNCNFGAGVADEKYDKHVLGHDDRGNPTRTPDMPEYDREGGFEDYVSDAQKLMCSSTCPAGAREVVRSSDNAVIRMDSRGRVGIRQGGRITTFFRPDEPAEYLAEQGGR